MKLRYPITESRRDGARSSLLQNPMTAHAKTQMKSTTSVPVSISSKAIIPAPGLAAQTSASKFEEVTCGPCNGPIEDKRREGCRDRDRGDSRRHCRGSFYSLTRSADPRQSARHQLLHLNLKRCAMEYTTNQSMSKEEKIAGVVVAAIVLAIVACAALR